VANSVAYAWTYARGLYPGNTKGGKYHCTVDLLFDWFGISCVATDNFCLYLQNRLIPTGQTGGQRYSDTSPFSITSGLYPGNSKGGEYHCTVDLLFDWFGISCVATDNFCLYLQNRLIQTGQTGVQRYSDTSPFSILCLYCYDRKLRAYSFYETELTTYVLICC
jgi:hypothetical protein